jgi:hypothetical protein
MGHGKSLKLPKKITRQRSWNRSQARKDRNVFKSSHGKFKTVADLVNYERRLKKLPKWIPPTPKRAV